MAQELTPEQAKSLGDSLQKINRLSIDSAKSAHLLYNALKDTADVAKGDLGIRKEVLKSYITEIDQMKKLAKVGVDIYNKEKERLKNLVNMDVHLEKQQAVMNNINLLNEKGRKIQEQEIDIMRKKGQMAKAYFSEVAMNAKRSFQTESGHVTGASLTQGTANAAVAAHGIANDPKSALSALGPYGEIIKIIADVIDGVRLLTAGLQSASAESGNFTKSFATSAAEASNVMYNQANLMTNYGMTVEEVSGIYKELKGTGIAALGIIPQTGDAMSDLAKDTMAFAKASNQTTAQVAGQMAQLVRINGTAKEKLEDGYNKIYSAAARMAEKGQASVSEVMSAAFSMSKQFEDISMGIGGISEVIEGVGEGLKKLGRPGGIDMIAKVSEGILGLSKASEGWQVLMGQASGMSGGFLSTLFKVQQRQSDMTNAAAGQYNAGKNIDLFNNMTKQFASGPDQRMNQLMKEKLGAQMGMDSGTVQVMQRMQSGDLSKSKGMEEMKKLQEAAKENNMSSKGMFDILRNILIGMIAKPLMYIWKWTAKGSDQAEAIRMTGIVNTAASKGLGSDVFRTGKIMANSAAATSVTAGSTTSSGGKIVHEHVVLWKDPETGKIIKKLVADKKKNGT